MSVANILSNIQPEEIDYVWIPPGGGGGPTTLSAVLTAGNSAGCQTMTDVNTVEGCVVAGVNLTIQTNALNPNSDLILATANSTDDIQVNAGEKIFLTTTASTPAEEIQMNTGKVVIQPSVAYPYSASEVGVSVNNFINPVVGASQVGIHVDTVLSTGVASAITISNVTAPSAEGIIMNGITGDTATGFAINSTNANNGTCYGVILNGCNAINGPSTGLEITNCNSDGDTIGVNASIIQNSGAFTNAVGLQTTNVQTTGSAGSATGVKVIAVNVSGALPGGEAIGMSVDTVANTTSGGRATGVSIQGVQGNANPAKGIRCVAISSTGSTSDGIDINSVSGAGAHGMNFSSIFSTSTADARGLSLANVTNTGGGSAFGLYLDRGSKTANSLGRQVKLLNGLLSLNTQFIDTLNPTISLDAGNLVVFGAGVAGTVNLGIAGSGPLDGDWLLLQKTGGAHTIADANGNTINGLATFNFTAGSQMCLLFYSTLTAPAEWKAHGF